MLFGHSFAGGFVINAMLNQPDKAHHNHVPGRHVRIETDQQGKRLDNRITSYNVCYTKLLRVDKTRPGSDSLL